VFDASLPVGTEVVETDAIFFRVDDVKEFIFAVGPLGGIDFHFEDGVLDTLSVVETGFGGVPQPAFSLGSCGGNIIGDEDIHGRPVCWLFPDEGRIHIEIAAQEASHQAGLKMDEQADGGFLAEE